MMVGTLTRMSSNHVHLRTPSVDGVFEKFPTVGESFVLVGKPLDPLKTQGWRYVKTTPVEEEVHEGDTIQFKTENSSYLLVVHSEDYKLFSVSELEKLEVGLALVGALE